MSDDLTVPAPAWPVPETVQPAPRKQRWGVVAIVVVIGLALVVASSFYSRQQHDDRADAQRDRDKASALVKEEQRKLKVATDRYDTAKASYDEEVRSARRLALKGSELADQAKTATDLLVGYSDLVRNLTQAWLNGNVGEFNRLVGEANTRNNQVADSTNAMLDAAQQLLLGNATQD